MKLKSRALSVLLAASLTVGTVIPASLAVWADNGYINEDCAAKNTYDEEDINYSSEKTKIDGKEVYVTVRDTVGDGEYYLSKHGAFTENVGVDGSNAIRFYQVGGENDVSYLRIFTSEKSDYNWFVPDYGYKYKVKLSYKSQKNYKAVLREVGSYGEIGSDDKELAQFSDCSQNGEWKIAEAEFTAQKNATSIYIAFVTVNGVADTEAELYVDNVAVEKPTKAGVEKVYSNALVNLEAMESDGWKGYYSSNPLSGVAFDEIDKLSDVFEIWNGIVRSGNTDKYGIKWTNDWQNNPFDKMSAATYTAQKYKYFTLDIEYKFDGEGRPWPVVTFGQPNKTPEMFYYVCGSVSNPTYNGNVVGVHTEYAGSLNINGKDISKKRSLSGANSLNGKTWHKLRISVTPDGIYSAVYKDDGVTPAVEVNTALPANYESGYITLMLNGWSLFRNIKITEIEVEDEKTTGYKSSLTDLTAMEEDSWKGYYSSNPQAGVEFAEIGKLSDVFEIWNGIVRSGGDTKKYGIKYTNDWEHNPFSCMSAATYTAQKYKYFTLEVEYKFESAGRPWPVVTFGQPNKTPEMFYRACNDIQNPTYNDGVVGVHVEYQGHLNVNSKDIRERYAVSDANSLDGTAWHKLRISVTPDGIYSAVYKDDGVTAVSEINTQLPTDYEGGYITLMLNGWSLFRNISITEYELIDMSQTEDAEQCVLDIDESAAAQPIFITTNSKRLYDLSSVSAVTESGLNYKIEYVSRNLYKLEKLSPLKLTVTYAKRELDYDPEYMLKYYFDWSEELDDFTATRAAEPATQEFKAVDIGSIWKISDGVLQKPNIDLSDTTKTNDVTSDFNILMLKDIKFRNFELTVKYKHGRGAGFSCGVMFGLKDELSYYNTTDGGIFATVEADARAALFGKSLRNGGSSYQIVPGYSETYDYTNVPGYPRWDTTQIHTMKLVVLDGRVNMYIDDVEEPIVGMIPKDFYGHIALAVGNNKGWYDELTIQPTDEWGNRITLAENEKQDVFNAEDIEADTWTDNSVWGEAPNAYYED